MATLTPGQQQSLDIGFQDTNGANLKKVKEEQQKNELDDVKTEKLHAQGAGGFFAVGQNQDNFTEHDRENKNNLGVEEDNKIGFMDDETEI